MTHKPCPTPSDQQHEIGTDYALIAIGVGAVLIALVCLFLV